MNRSRPRVDELLRKWENSLRPGGAETDYSLLEVGAGVHAGRSRAGAAALLIELTDVPSPLVGRRSAGFELLPYGSLAFVYGDRRWTSGAAALVNTDPELLSVFAVLAADVEERVSENGRMWKHVVAIVEEWQSLMAPRGRPSAESEVGLWGELWLLAVSTNPDLLLAGWRGPDREEADFFVDGTTVEVKTSRQAGQHHVSLSQLLAPMGQRDAWLLSLWVGLDPIRGCTVPSLADRLIARVTNPSDALRRLATAGYVPADRQFYEATLVLLIEPRWYAVTDVPKVRVVDSGVSRVRYMITLDESLATSDSASLWWHFIGREYEGVCP
jgi:hypothetical protein